MTFKAFLRERLAGSRLIDPYYISHSSLKRVIHRASQTVKSSRMLDVGCGQKPYRGLFDSRVYIGVDLPTYGPQAADVFATALLLPFCDSSFDAVLCTEVLEHVPEPERLFQEITRLLKPGGTLILATPQTWGLHLEPYDYFRYTRYGLETLATRTGLVVETVEPTCGVWATLGQRATDTIYSRYGVGKPMLFRTIVLLSCAAWNTLALALDRLNRQRSDTLDNVLVARKPNVSH